MTRRTKWDELPLFATDQEIGAALLGSARACEFGPRATLLEKEGFPKIDLAWGGRYTPAVKQFYDVLYGLKPRSELPRQPGGVERPDAFRKRA